ncbi:hypothetical protein FOC84_17920 [Achromobacter pestifer]|uniref:Uncharacterized protein n=1 Tax=Achromobacter pestifer TaxID=1353889 RepID=A0A7D4E2R4_9BURK|nr:hypothetical protein [Achromobacter pestifer]QKH36730.1 hypothetical protein FOC84_17920 [Achromobacter pestifer]
MNHINQFSYSAVRSQQPARQDLAGKTAVSHASPASGASGSLPASKTGVSSLARLLSEAGTRAAARDASTSREGLVKIVDATVDKLIGDGYRMNKSKADAEVPKSDDPQRLALAKQATDFANGAGPNPFKGMSREQLALITYDDSGAFTVNERQAAWREDYDQDQVWRRGIIAKLNDDSRRIGRDSPQTLQEMLDYHRSLPPILRAQEPQDYEAKLEVAITQSKRTESTPQKDEFQSLLTLLLKRLSDDQGKRRHTVAPAHVAGALRMRSAS